MADLGDVRAINGISLQGRGNPGYGQKVTKFALKVSTDGTNFEEVRGDLEDGKFEGMRRDSDDTVFRPVYPPVSARYVRLQPIDWVNHISLRWEVFAKMQ